MITNPTTSPEATEAGATSTPLGARARARTSQSPARTFFRSLLIGVLALLGVGLAAGTASATVAGSSGTVGPSYIGQVGCSNKAYNNVLQIEVPPPAIYARNFNAGVGNDAQYVRYRMFLVDVRTGATVAYTGYSGIAVATDNAPSRFAGNSFFTGASNGQYIVQVRVEWLNNARNAVVGWVAHSFDNYRYFDVYNSYRGTFETCKKF